MDSKNEQLTDRELILMSQTGNEQALEILVARYLPMVFRACARLLQSAEEAEDAAQNTFIKVWKNLKKADPERNFRAWVMEIAKNTCLDAIKGRRSLPMSAFDDEDGNNLLVDSLASHLPTPLENAEQSLLARLLNGAMEKLSPAYRKVLDLYYKKGLNFREIAESLNEPLHTVKSRHRRALINLRLILAKNK